MNKLITIHPVSNRKRLNKRSLDSMLFQSHMNSEIIITGDSISDDIKELTNRYGKKFN